MLVVLVFVVFVLVVLVVVVVVVVVVVICCSCRHHERRRRCLLHHAEPWSPCSIMSEIWLRDDLEEVCALLFRFLGCGFPLAMSNAGWLVTQKFVILVPDPIGFAPWSVLFGRGEPCDSC